MKTNKILSLMVAVIMLLGVAIPTDMVFADTDGTYTYTTTGGEATITNYTGPTEGSIVIPTTLGGVTVTKIGDFAGGLNGQAFASVTIPDSVAVIGSSAFKNNKISELKLGSGVKEIGFQAFYNNTIAAITIPDGVVTIGVRAFAENNLATVVIPGSVKTIGDDTFSKNGPNQDSESIPTDAVLKGTWKLNGTKWEKLPPFSGDGTEANPYQVETAEQLSQIGEFSVKEDDTDEIPNYFKLTKDIDLAGYNNGNGWTPIEVFGGNLDGGGHLIKNMKVVQGAGGASTGLFEGIHNKARVENLGIEGADVKGTEDGGAGILAGGAVGDAHIENVYVTGKVTGETAVGGLLGFMASSLKTVKNCYALANVSGASMVGGLVGGIQDSAIKTSYFVGTVTGTTKGGITCEGDDAGDNTFVSNYFNNTEAIEIGSTGGTSKSAVEMKNKSTFLAGAGEEIWDFNTVWTINPAVNNGYPTLRVFGVAPIVTPPSTGGGRGGSSTPTVKTPDSAVTVNGQKENAGKETKQTVDGKVQVVLRVDTTVLTKKIEDVLKSKTDSKQNLVELAVGSGDKATVQLTGDMVKKMETGKFDLSITKDKVVYKIPASEITIDKVAGILAVNAKDLKAISVDLKINEVSEAVLAKYNEIAKKQESKFVVKPVEFEIVAKTTGTDGKVRETTVSKFTNYVERVIAIPEGVAKGKITTGVVFNPDGTFSHVPTDIFLKDGKYYAKLNSLTNSTYSVIENPIEVASVKGHWSEKTVNDMASRLVLVDYKNFEPNKAVTRAEFADYIVRALGLYREGVTVKSSFKDVTEGSKNQVSIQIASDWGILSGYPDGTFKATNTITRQEAMTMYAKAMDIAKILENKSNKLATYTDKAKVATWANPSATRVVNAEIFNGKGNGVLDPKGTLTEAESLTAIRNLLLKAELINQ